MKKAIALSLVILICLGGCSKKNPQGASSLLDSSPPENSSRQESSKQEKQAYDATTPEGAASILLDKIGSLDKKDIELLISQYMSMDEVPDAYYNILQQISKRLSYKIGNSRTNGNSAMVDVTVTSVDAQKALNSVMPGAVAHLAALQIAGKDISSPEKILAEYAAANIDWNKIPTIKTDSTLYLIKGADGKWEADINNPDNLGFANAVSGGAIDLAQSLKSFAERFK